MPVEPHRAVYLRLDVVVQGVPATGLGERDEPAPAAATPKSDGSRKLSG